MKMLCLEWVRTLCIADFVRYSQVIPICLQGDASSIAEAETEWESHQEGDQEEKVGNHHKKDTSEQQEEEHSDHREEQASE